ncbi:MAG: ankyrin repeat domain-containing protein [Rickettsiaceae bacterium H1]|nr:ankyrin repeat domain-containing protein [Rickettsiaceae bacterium H1]
MRAARHGHTNIAKLLLIDLRACINIRDNKEGKTALMLAAESGYTEVVKLLLQYSADVDAQTQLKKV